MTNKYSNEAAIVAELAPEGAADRVCTAIREGRLDKEYGSTSDAYRCVYGHASGRSYMEATHLEMQVLETLQATPFSLSPIEVDLIDAVNENDDNPLDLDSPLARELYEAFLPYTRG